MVNGKIKIKSSYWRSRRNGRLIANQTEEERYINKRRQKLTQIRAERYAARLEEVRFLTYPSCSAASDLLYFNRTNVTG
uniref:Uncharacterized protein n=1 Tax=Onchocerca volvulus TaxID=6282 RepID=A0A8R1XR80_ONCVO